MNGASPLLRAAAVVALLLLAVWGVASCIRTDAERVEDLVDEARAALVEGRDADFLAAFAPDVVYQRNGDRAALEADLARYRAAGRLSVFVLQRTVTVDRDTATVALDVAIGLSILQSGRVEVNLVARRTRDDDWRVGAFSWRVR